jgi:parallel beta-helix repeat protein
MPICKKLQEDFLAAMLFGLMAILQLAVGPAHALIPVDPAGGCPQMLSAPGEYVLTGDLACSGAVHGVIITASDVTFHLAGRTISNPTCDPTGTEEIVGIFVHGGISGVRIDGGTVSGFNDGIVLSSTHSRVEGMTVTNACFFGILGQGQDNQIERNVVTASGDGIALAPASNTRVASNDLSGNVRAGVAISDCAANNRVENNILNNNGGTGEGYGVAIFNGTSNVIRNNTANQNDCGIAILSAVNPTGNPDLGNTVDGNTLNGNAQIGIWIAQDGAPSAVRGNTVLGSGTADMLDVSADCAGNSWMHNTFETDLVGMPGVSDDGPGAGCIR